MKTFLACLFAVCAATVPLRAEEGPPRELRIDSSTAPAPIGKAHLSVDALTRGGGDSWQGGYKVDVTPLSFASEQGKLTITLSNESLRKLTAGQAVDFSGQANSTNGNQSGVQGTATPADGSKDTGAIRVRINSKKGKLVFKTTYHLVK